MSRRLVLAIIVVVLAIIFLIMFINQQPERGVVKLAKATKLDIFTNKTEYKQGETIKILISNYAKNPLIQETISYSENPEIFLGKNYGVGLIEKLIENRWTVIEPVWRCNESCFEPCEIKHIIESGEKKVFAWNQIRLLCDFDNKTEERVEVGLGKYRVVSGLWNEEEQKSEVIFSNEFIIN